MRIDIPGEYMSLAVANYFIKNSNPKSKYSVDILKLLKLVYFMYGYTAAYFDTKLFSEDFQAWKHGPVLPSLYFSLNKHGYNYITEQMSVLDYTVNKKVTPIFSKKYVDGDFVELIEVIWEKYGAMHGLDLVRVAHKPQSPWAETYKDGEGRNAIISYDLTKKYYQELIISAARNE